MAEPAPVLMLHGLGCTGAVFARFAAVLCAAGRRCETPTLAADRRLPVDPPADLPDLTLKDHLDEAAGWARALETQTGRRPVVVGHSMGGLLAQKLAEADLVCAAVLLTPAPPAAARSKAQLAQVFTFANVVFASRPETKSHRIWKTGFRWGVLNRTHASAHDAIHRGAVFDSGQVYADLSQPPAQRPHPTADVDPGKVRVPLLVIGAAHDRVAPPLAVRRVADFHGANAVHREYADHGHWIVGEPNAEQVASDILAWLDATAMTRSTLARRPAGAAPF